VLAREHLPQLGEVLDPFMRVLGDHRDR